MLPHPWISFYKPSLSSTQYSHAFPEQDCVYNSCLVVLPVLYTLFPRFCQVVPFYTPGDYVGASSPTSNASSSNWSSDQGHVCDLSKQSLPSRRYDLCFCFLDVSSGCQMTSLPCSVAAASPFCSVLSYPSSCQWLTLPEKSFRATVSKGNISHSDWADLIACSCQKGYSPSHHPLAGADSSTHLAPWQTYLANYAGTLPSPSRYKITSKLSSLLLG